MQAESAQQGKRWLESEFPQAYSQEALPVAEALPEVLLLPVRLAQGAQRASEVQAEPPGVQLVGAPPGVPPFAA